jgi:hypothetical protein
MTRRYSHSNGIAELGMGLALLAVLVYRPDWISAAVMAYAKFWDGAVTPWLIQLFVRG